MMSEELPQQPGLMDAQEPHFAFHPFRAGTPVSHKLFSSCKVDMLYSSHVAKV
jgi:hypothetical protein